MSFWYLWLLRLSKYFIQPYLYNGGPHCCCSKIPDSEAITTKTRRLLSLFEEFSIQDQVFKGQITLSNG